MPKVQIENTNLPTHLEEMLKLLIEEDHRRNEITYTTNNDASTPFKSTCSGSSNNKPPNLSNECLDFVLTNRPLDLLTDIYLTDSLVGASVCVLNWMRRFFHKSILQPTQKLNAYCSKAAGRASPYEEEEIVYLLNVAGVIRKDLLLLHLFLSAHEHSWAVALLNPSLGMKVSVNNTSFENAKLETKLQKPSLLQEKETASNGDEKANKIHEPIKTIPEYGNISCDCTENDLFVLLDTILRYINSADSTIVVRTCEAALILISLPTIGVKCNAQKMSFETFSKQLSQILTFLCQEIPEDMDTGKIEDFVSTWGLLPCDADAEAQYFIGKPQLMEFLCWFNYTNRLAKECCVPEIVRHSAENIRVDSFEMSIEPMISILDISIVGFMLVLMAKIIRQIDAPAFSEELATWLVGSAIVVDSDDLAVSTIENAAAIIHTDSIIQALLDNPNARILHSMLFRYLEIRGYYDANATSAIQTWSDEEDEREKRRSTASDPHFDVER